LKWDFYEAKADEKILQRLPKIFFIVCNSQGIAFLPAFGLTRGLVHCESP